MVRRGKGAARTGPLGEAGASMAEYMPLLGVIALLVMFAVAYIGPWVGNRLIDPTVVLDADACQPGWMLIPNEPMKNGPVADKNGDGYACRKVIPGDGQGNSEAGETNVKDNHRGPQP